MSWSKLKFASFDRQGQVAVKSLFWDDHPEGSTGYEMTYKGRSQKQRRGGKKG